MPRRALLCSLDGYVRVSRVGGRRGPRFISPSVQREALVSWAKKQGFELARVFEELDESGARADRPMLQDAIQRVEAGVTTGVVVWRVDRFGRSLIDGLRQVERVRAVGGTFYSVQDGLDTSTEAGRLVMRILLSVAEFQREGIRSSWDVARERAIKRGVYVNPTTPVGYVRTRAGHLKPHPRTGPIITELFARRAQGESSLSLARYLETNQLLTGRGNPGWTVGAVGRLVRSRVYLGEMHHGPYVNATAHAALTDAATWQQAQRPRPVTRHDALPVLLSGLIRCSACRHALKKYTVRLPGRAPYVNYRCEKYHPTGACPAPTSINASKIEPYVIEVALSLVGRRRRRPDTRLADAQQRAQEAAKALDRYRDNDQVARSLGPQAFAVGIETRRRRLADANLNVFDARARSQTHDLPPVDQVRDAWPNMTLKERRQLLSKVIDVIFVARGHASAADRVTVCPTGTGPRDLPRVGIKPVRQQPITPRRGWINPQPASRP